MNFLDILKQYGASGALILILVFFGNSYMQKIQKIETQLLSIKVQLTKLQTTIVPAGQLQTQMKQMIKTHEMIYHSNYKK